LTPILLTPILLTPILLTPILRLEFHTDPDSSLVITQDQLRAIIEPGHRNSLGDVVPANLESKGGL
jgi:hypothetical protein